MATRKLAQFSPGRIILLSIFFTILAGTALLALPMARLTDVSFIDLFFTSASATCVTGLFTIPLEQFTLFGKAVILALIQIGGLGLITMTLFLMSLIVDMGMATQLMAGQLLELESWQNVKKILLFIITITLSAELIGALIFFMSLKTTHTLGTACFLSVFHSVSSFCNAGISLDIAPEVFNYPVLLTTIGLMLFGGLGFITWYEIMQYLRFSHQKKRYAFSLHSKIILYGTGLIIVSATALFWLLEHSHAFANQHPVGALFHALFTAASCRSTGFLTVPVGNLQMATLFVMMILTFIGSSPGSTGSGVKVTTVALFLATIKAAISGRTSVEIHGRQVPRDQAYKAIAIISLSLFWIACTTLCLLVTESNWGFIDVFFETVSAFGTLGLSTGITPYLSTIGKLFIVITMVIGRIGSLTLILALRKRAGKPEFSYPEERVMLS